MKFTDLVQVKKIYYRVSQKMSTKLIKLNLKLTIRSINNMLLFIDSTKSNLNFEPLFAAIHEVLREILLFEHEFQARNFGQL